MSDFVEFYKNGGIFNHLVTVGLGMAVAALVFHARARKHEPERAAAWLTLCDRTLLTCIGLGLLGVLFGTFDASAVLLTLPPEKVLEPALRVLGLLGIPLTWALLGTFPLWIVSTVLRFRQAGTASG